MLTRERIIDVKRGFYDTPDAAGVVSHLQKAAQLNGKAVDDALYDLTIKDIGDARQSVFVYSGGAIDVRGVRRTLDEISADANLGTYAEWGTRGRQRNAKSITLGKAVL